MKQYKIILLFTAIASIIGFSSCEDTIWPEVQKLEKAEYTGVWNTTAYRTVTAYTRLQDPITFDYSYKDTTYTDSTQTTYSFGLANKAGTVIEDSVLITFVQTVKGVVKAPVIKAGYFTVSKTASNDYTEAATYINIWEKAVNVHGTFVDPYYTYTVVMKNDSEMHLSWVLNDNTAQNSKKYNVVLTK